MLVPGEEILWFSVRFRLGDVVVYVSESSSTWDWHKNRGCLKVPILSGH